MSRYFSTSNAPEYFRCSTLYERKAVTDLWNKLTVVAKKQWQWKNLSEETKRREEFFYSHRRKILIYGPPGSGKSSATFGWLDKVCSSLQTGALWISCPTDECWWLDGKQGSRCSITTHCFPTCAEDASGYCAVVFDGVRKQLLDPALEGIIHGIARTGVATFVVSSESVRFRDGQSNDIIKLQHFVPSWTKEEYNAACKDDVFWRKNIRFFEGALATDNAERRTELISSKFEVAGHSARFMFNQSSTLVADILKKSARAIDVTKLERAMDQVASSGSVNTVVARLKDDKNGTTPVATAIFPTADDLITAATSGDDFVDTTEEHDTPEEPYALIVSNFATQRVLEKIRTNVGKLRSLAKGLSNRAILGYAFEKQLENSLQKSLQQLTNNLQWRNENGVKDPVPVGAFVQWEKDEVEEKLARGVAANTWVFVGGRQGLFDAIHVQSQTHIRFVQATVGKEHSFKLSILASMMHRMFLNDAWPWTHVDFVMLRPSDERFEPFAIKPPDGALQPTTLRFDGSRWARDGRQSVSIRYLDWTE